MRKKARSGFLRLGTRQGPSELPHNQTDFRGWDSTVRSAGSFAVGLCFAGPLPDLSVGLSAELVGSPPSWMINGSAPSGAFCRADMAASLSVLYSPTPIRISRAGGCILSRPAIAGRGRDASWAVLAVRLDAGTRPRSRVMRERQRVLEVTCHQLETESIQCPR